MLKTAPRPGKAESSTTRPRDQHDVLALELANKLASCAPRRGDFRIPELLQNFTEFFQLAYQYFDGATKTEVSVSHTAEWLLDNFYILEQAIRHVEEDMPADYYQRLPKTEDGWPRIYILALAITQQNNARFDIEHIKSFINAFQNITPLRIGELWALPLMLRLTALESLAAGLASITKLKWDIPPQPKLWQEQTGAASDILGKEAHEVTAETIVVNSILNLRLLATQDWKAFFESTSVLEQILQNDPANVYGQMDFETRNHYRSVIEELALGSSVDETGIALQILQLAQAGQSQREKHVGYYLIGRGAHRLEAQIAYHPNLRAAVERFIQRHATGVYLGSITLLTVLFTSMLVLYAARAGGSSLQIFLAGILTVLPASSVAIGFVNWLLMSIIPPRTLPKLDFETGIPAEYRTMVVIPALLSSQSDADFLIRQIEHHFLANPDPNLFFALITDFADAPEQKMPNDQRVVAPARTAIERLNKKYGKRGYRPFYLFHRERMWNPGEESWMGWERKRGKLEEFNKLLRGDNATSFIIKFGNLNVLPTIRYVITLDADTLLPRESAHRLVGTLAHPLNQAEFDPVTDEVVDGYTVLQPRTQVRPVVANQSVFTRTYSGDSIIDLYTRAVSDIYQDLFGEGNYVGKGIYDVDAFQKSLKDRIPENRLLSHDLFEGIHGRCGLVTDVVLFEDYPPHYLTYTDRIHRWVRGDWQLLPWLGSQVPHRAKGAVPNPLSLIDRWKLFDNLRRSLVPPLVLVLMVSAWLFLPGFSLGWMIFALAPYWSFIITNLIGQVRHFLSKKEAAGTQSLRLATLRSLFEVIFLPHEALIISDAIITALFRMYIQHKKMLEWVTAAHTVRVFGRTLKVRAAWQAMVVAPAIAVALFLLISSLYPQALMVAAPILLGWVLSPYVAARISRPIPHKVERLTPAQERKLHLLARSTWLYFEHFVGPEDRWLPPDHFQEFPRGQAAHSTSPTNIGLMLLSTLSAHDLGYMGPLEFSLRIRDAFDSMDGLERVRGHFLNWYDTRSFVPLPPRYISTVDSGNLAASLIVLREGCLEIPQGPLVKWGGLLDTLDLLSYTLEQAELGDSASQLRRAIESLHGQVKTLNDPDHFSLTLLKELLHDSEIELENMLWEAIQNSNAEIAPEVLRNLSTWINRVRYHLKHIRIDLQVLAPWLLALPDLPRLQPDSKAELISVWTNLQTVLTLHPKLGELPDICKRAGDLLEQIITDLDESNQPALDWCKSLAYDLESARKNSASLLEDYAVLASRSEAYFQAMNFSFLFDSQRRVFHIGYNVESGRLDPNYYDLLASEARIASLIAIARGDVSQNHWLYLARPLTQVNDMRALLSWSGTMFEYLMPTLFADSLPNTLLDQSCVAAVEEQIRYASEHGIPWGISEASYYAFDTAQIYQYRAFGVPSLGYKRGLAEDLVVAPYASILALPFAPQAVMQNLEWFEKLNMWGPYGLYESVDFTPERLKTGEKHAIVRSFMAHHQGMILLSLSNYLFNKRMIQRFHSDLRIQSIELLLQEQTPADAPTEHPRPQPMDSTRGTYTSIPLDPWRVSPDAPYTQLHSLSNGKYSLLITAAGSGFSRWGNIELTRWRADPTLDNWGNWIYVEDRLNGQFWSATRQPSMIRPDRSEVRFFPHRAEFERQDDDVILNTTVSVAPNDNVEIRRVTLINNGYRSRQFALTSYAEIILADQSVDQRHPAFNKLFIDSEFLPKEELLLFRRRPRSAEEKPLYLAHFFISNDGNVNLSGYETDRARFIGRGGASEFPKVFSVSGDSSRLSGTTGATLDPICALQAEISLPAFETVRVAFITLAAGSRKEALDLARRYRRWSQLRRVIEDARIHSERELSQLDLTSQEVEQIQKLLSPLLYPSAALRAESNILAANTLGQPGLWTFGISGDYPILLVRLKSEENLGLLYEVLLAHNYWRKRGLIIDLVIFNQHETSYQQDFRSKVGRLLARTGGEAWISKRGGIFIVNEDQMNESERILLRTVARVILDGEAGSLAQQLSKLDSVPLRLPRFVSINPLNPPSDPLNKVDRPTELLFDNGTGGFRRDGREYVIYLEPDQWTPAPWTNVIATSEFGCLITESGMGCTWAKNSGENRLTPWRNDAISDTPSEAIYLRDEDTGKIWSPTPLPARANAPYLIRHGTGYSVFEHSSHGLEQEMRVFIVPDEPLKIVQLKLHNSTERMRRINVTYYAEWVLGTTHENTAAYIVPEFASGHFALLARNTYSMEFNQRVAFLACTREPHGVTTDRTEFLGSHGSYDRPAALERVGLTPNVQAGGDPCAALQLLLWLQPGETKEVTFLLGQGADRADAERLISHYKNIQNVEAAWEAMCEFWDEILEQTQVQTPDAGMNILLNRWLLYQALSCRFWGRTAFYQSSGAYGFRDQLQDAMGLIHVRPELVREHILEAASHQFEEGDVLHWWHPPSGRGIRTRCSDNLLWLPFVTAHYVRVTGDRSILAKKVPFLRAEPLKSSEHERYGQFPFGEPASLYEHCCRAISKGTTAGPHGIPLMGAHDWNDGMNRVGVHGQGESIWLGWFLMATLNHFADICKLMGDSSRADEYRAKAKEINRAIELSSWDGEWYRRAYYDDGSPLGSASNNECRIDSIAQSWSVISKGADRVHAAQAMESVHENLVRLDDGLILLFTPPFNRTARDPGYIKGYPPGIRENGGQYTHAALWAIWAFAQMGDGERAAELFRLINPIHHADTPEKVNRYHVEPYVIAADVYSMSPHAGRGGWTWYTGSAAWMYRLGLEMLLGLQRAGDYLQIKPSIPRAWPEYQLNYRFGKTMYHILVKNKQDNRQKTNQIVMDGETLADENIPLMDDQKTHEVVITLGSRKPAK